MGAQPGQLPPDLPNPLLHAAFGKSARFEQPEGEECHEQVTGKVPSEREIDVVPETRLERAIRHAIDLIEPGDAGYFSGIGENEFRLERKYDLYSQSADYSVRMNLADRQLNFTVAVEKNFCSVSAQEHLTQSAVYTHTQIPHSSAKLTSTGEAHLISMLERAAKGIKERKDYNEELENFKKSVPGGSNCSQELLYIRIPEKGPEQYGTFRSSLPPTKPQIESTPDAVSFRENPRAFFERVKPELIKRVKDWGLYTLEAILVIPIVLFRGSQRRDPKFEDWRHRDSD